MSAARFEWERVMRFGFALAIGATGGAILNHFSMPLAWMLGAMITCSIAAILRAPIAPLPQVLPITTAVIGVLLGSGFTPDVFRGMWEWLPSMAGLAIFITICAALGVFYFRVIGHLDMVTAILSAMPGGLVVMTTLGLEKGADANMIALVHSSRILLVVLSLPYVILLVTGSPVPAVSATSRASIFEVSLNSELLLLLLIFAGMALGRFLRLPAKYLLGPMILSAIVHTSGLSSLQPAGEIVIIAQIVLGTLVGSRFAGISPRHLLKVLLLSSGSVAILLLAATIAAKVLNVFLGYDTLAILLAFSPGGLTEMSLIAFSMQVDVAFVSGHHIARVLLVIVMAVLIFRLIRLPARSRQITATVREKNAQLLQDDGGGKP